MDRPTKRMVRLKVKPESIQSSGKLGTKLEQGTGDTMMIQMNTFSMALFALLANSAALLSLPM